MKKQKYCSKQKVDCDFNPPQNMFQKHTNMTMQLTK